MEMYILRNLVMRYGAQIDLHPNQKEFLWHILDFDHTGKNFSWPSLQTVGARMGITSNAGVRKIAKGLSQKRLIKICEVPGKSNRYDYTNLMKRLQPFWEAEAKNGGHLDENHPPTEVDGLNLTPQQKLGTPPNKS